MEDLIENCFIRNNFKENIFFRTEVRIFDFPHKSAFRALQGPMITVDSISLQIPWSDLAVPAAQLLQVSMESFKMARLIL